MRIVAKIGGAALVESTTRRAFALAVRRARDAGHEVALVHGGGAQVRSLADRLGLAEAKVDGLRVTDAPTAEVVLAVLGGTVNRELVRGLCEAGVAAVGLTGADGGSYSAAKHTPGGVDLGYVGRVASVRPELLAHLCAGGYTPVLASVAPADPPGEPFYNINADHAVAPLAAAFAADAVLFLTDVPGLLDSGGAKLDTVSRACVAELAESGALRGGMLPKLDAALEACAACPGALVKIAPADGDDCLLAALEPRTGTRVLEGSARTWTST